MFETPYPAQAGETQALIDRLADEALREIQLLAFEAQFEIDSLCLKKLAHLRRSIAQRRRHFRERTTQGDKR